MSKETQNKQNFIILWGVSISPYVRKVMVALAEKGIAYEQKEILPKVLLEATGQKVPVEFNQASPLGKIPALQIGDYSLADSAVIAAYLDRKFSTGNQLYPRTPEAYAKARWFEQYSDTVLTDIAYHKIFLERVIKPKVLNQAVDEKRIISATTQELPAVLDYLQNSLSKNLWLAGHEFSMADVAVATQFLALEMTGFEFPKDRWARLHEYFKQIISRASFKGIA
ncbi:glutathione S-transferase family protein [Coxiella burnetii]|uniref:glutathione S-transferase family protein n=1 Tax=Coxiella burnetii TaxID=777 RepID=UPI0000ED0317|nr:glutathione S-transferase family protein [Coxiella burnetii]ACJ19943.1 glutathione S-transferase [Coxiella burnetii CbuK_Q154]AIT62964.1 Glutathione S-transferase family protein [Coxiella burnetii str. Namibia]ATN85396.1 glutathione S-transferase [Coxiella burnetii str. Schperling]EAX32847.1 glutathione S-transferase [Coxiella burnetii 'MSU Goat Q177']EDR36003.1 glutathione S-transferase family protein [Coxiella burnetii Q321]